MFFLRIKFQVLIIALLLCVCSAAAQTNIRYVSKSGNNNYDGRSWVSAKADIQAAINDLVTNNLTGEVWVAEGTYYPTESTESSSNPLYKSFKIPAGITVRGGFISGLTAAADGKNDKTTRPVVKDRDFGDVLDEPEDFDGDKSYGGVYSHKTILCGDNTPSKQAKFEWNSTKEQFDVTFYGNSYHVVWFAMNGFGADHRANPLTKAAKLEGCVIQGGHAYSHDINDAHPHIGYGGGIYMVANSYVYNCEVMNCDASRNGGGIYMDGGGIVKRTYVHDCQALGLGAEFGLGGGICEDGAKHNSKANPVVVAQSVVSNCVGRMGGGIALVANHTDGNNKFAVVSNATLVNNNTATVEAGGVYAYKGGAVANMTIVRNKCNGSGIMQDEVVTGRSGGLYNRDASYVCNSVIWGNKCGANQDVQYASSRTNLTDSEKTKFYYNAVSNMDDTDWSGSTRMGVLALDNNNHTSGEKSTLGYPLFFKPTATAGYLADIDHDFGDSDPLKKYYNWTVSSESFLSYAGVATIDLDADGYTPAPETSYDMQFGRFNARPTIGAFISEVVDIAPAANITYEGTKYDYAFFVDPDFIYAENNPGSNGHDWAHPLRFLGNALDFIDTNQKTKAINLSGKRVAVFVKEGTVNNTRTWGRSRIRVTPLDIPSNVSLFGSFSTHLTGTNLNLQNVVRTPSVISAKLMDDYDFNVAHLINITEKEHIDVHGFKLTYANASSEKLNNDNKDGAAITVVDSRDVKFHNVIVSNCAADHGSVVYADNSVVEFENCIFHNNELTMLSGSGLIYATNGSSLDFNHCDVLRNVGYASYLGTNNATNRWQNSIFYGNMDRKMDDTNSDMGGGITHALPAFSGNTDKATGNHCMFDANSASFSGQFGGYDTGNQWQYNLQYAFVDGTGQGYPRFINPTKNAGVTKDGDQTYYGRATSFEPHNNNPVVNMASDASLGKDIIDITRNYGGLPDIGAVENHEATEGVNAYKDGQKAYGEVLYVRDYRNNDGTIDTNITDRDGTSWERAINGNGDYSLSGTHTYKDTNPVAVMAYKINTGSSPNQYYLDVNNGTLNRVNSEPIKVPVINQETGDPVLDSNNEPITETYYPVDHCTVFILCDENGNELAASSGNAVNGTRRLKDASTGEFLYLDYVKNNNTYTFRTSANPPAAQAKATITASGGNYRIAYKANNTTKYISNANTIPGTTQTAWTFSAIALTVDHGTGALMKDVAYDMGTFKGLQYAVNKAHIAYKDDLSFTADPHKAKKQVWVGAGTYQRDPAKNNSATPAGLIDMDTENCFVIQDGVDVFGAFPKTGNPGKDQRQALISQYVNNGTSTYNYEDYETILEPITQGIASGVTRRVLGQYWDYNPKKVGYKSYAGATWDGFTLRNGVMDEKTLIQSDADANRKNSPGRNGGGGACIYKNVTLKNVVVTNNTIIWSDPSSTQDFRAGGIYIDGGTLDAGYIINNLMEGWKTSSPIGPTQSGAAYGGGMYLYSGTVFNSVVANNRIYAAYADGAGIFIENANFFNNTIVNNKAEGTNRACGGVAIWTDASRGTASRLYVYNSIIAKNEGIKLGKIGNKDLAVQNGGQMELHNCISEDITDKEPEGSNNKIIFQNCQQVTNYDDIFVTNGSYSDRSDNNFKTLNLRLKTTATNAINKGNDAPVIGGAVYNLIDYNDMDFAERIQDCRIDIGAYEFNGATSVQPQVIDNQAIYYVTPEGYGTTNANDPANAACAEKLQRVLDAAGRYKYLNPQKQVIVKVANSYDLLHPKNVDGEGNPIPKEDERYVYPSDFKYYATRTTDWTDQDVRVWSIIVPRGVEVWGGYTDVASDNTHTNWTNENNGFYARSGSEGSYVYTDRRNITKYPTYFDSYYINKLEKMDAHTYHVVTFSDRIFDKNGLAYTKEDFKDKTAERVREILERGESSVYIELLDNDESHFVHMSEALPGCTGVKGNVIMDGDNPKNFGTAEAPQYASNRAVIDGIFVSGGQADASTNGSNSAVNINSYGGAALVNNFAYVRNCILTGNTATNGGALALTNNALVSGCLIMNNEATDMGGGIYVFEEGTKLSNGTTVNTTAPVGQTMDFNMPHVFTSTIVQNHAQRGGGVWYNDYLANVRFNSVAVWQNTAAEQANVFGVINPEQPTDDETISERFYPFSYSAIQGMRASGTNNLNLGGINHQGTRFVEQIHDVGTGALDQTDIAEEKSTGDKYAAFGYYGLTNYSLLCSNGMPKTMYNQLRKAIAIADKDILGTDRLPSDPNNIFVEIGARALEMLMPKKQLMLRLFVADPKYVDTETAVRFMRLNPGEEPADHESDEHKAWDAKRYYSQVGSSFAYPFNSLQNALDYIKQARNGKIITDNYDAQNLPFEILVGRGEYYPKQSLNAETQNVWAATFAIPEGVTIMGGFNPQGGDTNSYYGRYYEKDATKLSSFTEGSIYDNVKLLSTVTESRTPSATEIGRGNMFGEEKVSLPKITGEGSDPQITFQQWNIQDIADRRAMNDNNKNGIVEPWEFANQTIISGNSVNGETDGVYHVMTAVADANAVGNMPKVQKENSAFQSGVNETGYQWKEEGQQIRLNGLIITGGNALTYLSTALDSYGRNIFYQGAGLQVDGNRYNTTVGGTPEFHNPQTYGVGYRDIPVSVTNCQFRNNIAGYGGAISTNGSLSIFGSSFEQNLAIADTEIGPFVDGEGNPLTVTDDKVMYPGQGGAILATRQLSAFNTLFANNEARWDDEDMEPTINLVQHSSFRVPEKTNATPTLRAAGGAIMMGSAAQHHIVNCNFVRNKANAYPAVFTMNPTTKQDDVVNTHNYSQIINTVAWGNEVNPEMLAKFPGNTAYKTASKLMVNIGKKDRTTQYISDKSKKDFYDPSFDAGKVPTTDDLNVENPDADPAGGATSTKNTWQEAAWFCAYEDGVGFKPNNSNDLRDAIVYTAGTFAPKMIKDANNHTYQNCNILVVADNDDVAGPNFGNPSTKAGYDGFTESADWSPSRFNRLTDNGNGWIKQVVTAATNDFKVTFKDSEGVGTGFQGAYPYTHYISDIIAGQFPEYKLWIAISNEKYMQATNDEVSGLTINGTPIGTGGKTNKNIPRISPDPTMGVEKAYIDIGVYEYIKQPLLKPGSEVDILWVSTKEHPENGPADGMKWSTPTSNLQAAINTLLSSRNGHKKEIRIMEGEYSPVTPQTVNGKKFSAFVIDTKEMNKTAIVPSSYETSEHKDDYYAQSLTIKGGYSADIPFEYDPVRYKTVIRQNETVDGAGTDKLIYIADPTLRYYYPESAGVSGYTPANEYGAIYGNDSHSESYSAKAMPIQIDGVTLINDKPTAGKQGSAIYYPDYDDEIDNPRFNNEQEVSETNPKKIDGIKQAHSISVGGTVTYYKDKEHIGDEAYKSPNNVETDYLLVTGGDPKTNPAKIVISKTQIVGSGAKDGEDAAVASAVYVGKNGGSALIYNTVFHSNYGMPLDAWNTVNVNNTFGRNAGLVHLQNATGVSVESQMHNSALWLNNEVKTNPGTYGDQIHFGEAKPEITGTQTIFTYNAYTGGNTTATDYNEGGGTIAKNNYNTGLNSVNTDIVNGPNFVDPDNADIEARSFDIKPSIRLLNKGNGTRTPAVADNPLTPEDDSVAESYAGTYADKIVTEKYDYALASTTDRDVLYRTRIVSEGSPQKIDIGAYEFQGNLMQILYVDPNMSHRDEATGENWDMAFGYGDLQNAMDLAAVYHMNNPAQKSYVFAKGNSSTNKTLNTNETLFIRDGVTIYGSIIDGYTDWHDIQDPADPSKPKYRKEDGHGGWVYDIDKFIANMTFNREGVASNAASKTIVTGIKTSEYTAFDGGNTGQTPALVDGFVVTDPTPATAPVLDVTNTSEKAVIVVRNVVVADNTIDNSATGTDVNVAQISNGLIYEALFRDNKPKGNGAVLKVSNATVTPASPGVKYTTHGYAVNVTVEGKTVGADFDPVHADSYVLPVDGKRGTTDVESATQIFKSITNSINTGSGPNKAGAAAPYGQITNPGISGYFYNIADPNLNYQLTETSKYIDMCATDMVTTEGVYKGHPNFLPDNLKKFINYNTDRDLLGNPRYMRNVSSQDKIDRGAFETWKVDKNFVCGKWQLDSESDDWYGTNKDLDNAIAPHFYPHDGSVVYVMENKNLVIDPLGDHDVKATPENPGFLLVKKGANFYGNGRPVTAAYVAIERDVRKGGSIVAVPYAMNYNSTESVAKVETETHDGHADLFLNKQNGSAAYKYSGNERMDWKYIFQATDTKCWDQVSATAANQGALFQPFQGTQWYEESSTDNTTALLRFTGKGANLTDYIYRENGVSKDVTLTKYDDSESTNDGADYTDEKDMGWNCFGIPYLVSEYKPYEKVRVADADRNIVEKNAGGDLSMDIAHILWLYYDGKVDGGGHKLTPDGTQSVNGDGGYYSVNSWECATYKADGGGHSEGDVASVISVDTTNPWHVSNVNQQALWVGEGIFTQTATLQDTEALKFWLPVAPTSFPPPSSAKSVVRYYFDGTGIEETVSSDDVELVGTEYYTVDGLRIERPRRGQVVIIRNLYSNGSAKTSKMFVK